MRLNDTVRIKSENIIGTIVDISYRNGKTHYVVESGKKGALPGHDGGEWPLFDCGREDIETVMQGGADIG